MLHKKHENRLVELAMAYLDSEDAEKQGLYTVKKSGEIPQKVTASATVGKVASFGPTVIQIGLKPTLLFYQDEKRQFVTHALYEILKLAAKDQELRTDLAICGKFAEENGNKTLPDCVRDLHSHAELTEARELICAAGTALKWALRSLKVEKTDGD